MASDQDEHCTGTAIPVVVNLARIVDGSTKEKVAEEKHDESSEEAPKGGNDEIQIQSFHGVIPGKHIQIGEIVSTSILVLRNPHFVNISLLVKQRFNRNLLRIPDGIIICTCMSLFDCILVGSVLVFRVEGAGLVDEEESVVCESGVHHAVQRVVESHVHLVAGKSVEHVGKEQW